MVRDCLVIGINNTKIRKKLINAGSDLTLEKVQEISRLHEMSTIEAKTMAHNSGEDSKVNFIKKYEKKTSKHFQSCDAGKRQNYSETRQRNHSNDQKHCTRCGYRHGKKYCPAKGKTCGLCKKPNHFKKMCRSKRNVHIVDNENGYSSDGEEYYTGSIQMESQVNYVDHEELE